MATVTTPWGKATIVEEVMVPQQAGVKRFTTRVELLETAAGEQLVRLSYATDATSRRGPVTLRRRDLEKLAVAPERAPELRRALESALGG